MNDQQNSEPTRPTRSESPAEVDPKLPAASPADPLSEKKLRERVEEALGDAVVQSEVRARVVERVVRTIRSEFFRGPLPHPRHLKAYEETCPGLATRIVAMAEKAHSRQEDRLDKSMDYEFRDRRLGLFLGFFALLALLGAGLVSLALGAVAIGSTLMAASVIGTVIGTFAHGRRGDEGERTTRP